VESGVYVVGMHRSGTSAATRLISFLGLATPQQDDLVPPSAKNPTGYWESMSLVAFNTRLLAAVGSDFRWPARLAPGWQEDDRLAAFRREAPRAFRDVFPVGGWVWKDPRLCLTLAFWRDVLRTNAAAVLVNRNPLDIAASARRARGDESAGYTIALWERYLRDALLDLRGMPVLVTGYDELLEEPAHWSRRVHAFLTGVGIPVQEPPEDRISAFVDPQLRHSHHAEAELEADAGVSESQRELFRVLRELRGPHARFDLPELPPETPLTNELLNRRRSAMERSSAERSPRGVRLRARVRHLLSR
jgi:hypothetical protein